MKKLLIAVSLFFVLVACSSSPSTDTIYQQGMFALRTDLQEEIIKDLGTTDFSLELSSPNMVDIEEVNTGIYEMTGVATVDHDFRQIGFFTIRMVFDGDEMIEYEWTVDFN